MYICTKNERRYENSACLLDSLVAKEKVMKLDLVHRINIIIIHNKEIIFCTILKWV
jgi:hypothetical protein